MESERQIKVALNDGGGLALAVYADCYAHLYDKGKQLADDLLLLERGTNATTGKTMNGEQA